MLGGNGFGYMPGQGGLERMPHAGRCVIGDDVDIGSNSCIDRGSIDDTVVGDGTKIDNLVQIGHNVRLGRRCLVMAQVGIAGSARIGDGVMLAGQVGVVGASQRSATEPASRRSPAWGTIFRAARTTAGRRPGPTGSGCAPTPCSTGWRPIAKEMEALVRERKTHA